MINRDIFIKFHGREKEEVQACSEYVTSRWQSEYEHRLRIADEVTAQTFLFDLPWDMEQTTEPVVFDGEIDWLYQPGDDPEFIFQLNRHRYWVCLGQAYAVTGDETYAECFVAQLKHWIEHNPINEETKPKTWRTIEAGLRAESWIKSMGYMISSPAVTDQVLEQFFQALICHGEYLAACDVPFSTKSNWGVLENSGLYAIGKVLEAQQYPCDFAEIAKKRLLKQSKTQIMDDGVHWEQSPMYHNEVLKCFLEVLRIADRYQDEMPKELTRRVYQMAYVNRIWQKPDGTQPTVGDSDATDLRDILTICAYWFRDPVMRSGGFDGMDYEGIWDYGSKSASVYESLVSKTPEDPLFWLKESGNWYLRSGWQERDTYLHVRCGSLGGGHGHFDKLHLNLFVGGDEFFTDPGRYTYVDGEARRELKGSCAHNSVTIDGEDYSQCLDSWDVKGLGLPVNGYCNKKEPYTLIQCGHLGYMEKGIFINRRVLAIGTRIFLVMDDASASGVHTYEQNFHVPGTITVEPLTTGYRLCGRNGDARLFSINESVQTLQRECRISRHYNQLEAAHRLTFAVEGDGNTSILTAVICQDYDKQQPVSIKKVPVEAPASGRILDDNEAEAVRIQYGAQSYVVVSAHVDAGSDCEYIGACGCYGLGRVMVADLTEEEPEMTVLLW